MRRVLVVLGVIGGFSAFALAQPAPEPTAPAGGGMPLPQPPAPATVPGAPPAGWRVLLTDLTIFRLNPLGLETRARLGLQKRLYESSSKATQNNFMFMGVYPKLNPASAQLAVGGEIQPASVFNLRMFLEIQQYFGTLGFLQSFDSVTRNYSDHRLKELRDTPKTDPQAAAAVHISIQPLLQTRVGPLVIRSLLQLDYWDFALRDGDVAAYEPTFDTLLPDRGWSLSTDTDVLYDTKQGLIAGVRHTYVHPFYRPSHFATQSEAELYDGENGHHRIGLLAAYTFHDRGPTRFNKPTIVLIMSWYLSHRWRTGEQPDELAADVTADDFVSRAFPYFVLGFAFESDLLDVR